ncbi:hypothetical protein [Actinophytocola xanthii]|uniref:hypothetical protein n=1 Tax=Actinophytocola xanthii TaxID=1912961 RepID=UPI00117856AB|nr:hypothetical protein [Actinophytocola xanthii]
MSAPTRRNRRRFKKQTPERQAVVPFTSDDDAALCCIRQSHFSDESTSGEVQKRETHRWANAYGVPIVDVVAADGLHCPWGRRFVRARGPWVSRFATDGEPSALGGGFSVIRVGQVTARPSVSGSLVKSLHAAQHFAHCTDPGRHLVDIGSVN